MKLYVIGIGPGRMDFLSPYAKKIIQSCDAVAGYDLYLDLIAPLIQGKEIIKTAMRQEAVRCRAAVKAAAAGKRVCMVSGGDAGVYGMAGLVIEIAAREAPELEIEIIPGITAAAAGAALLGAPLNNDFAVVSLSDLLTPKEEIIKRLHGAFSGGFCVCLYNPASKKRTGLFKEACGIALSHLAPETPCGTVRNIAREGQATKIIPLSELSEEPVDMFTTVIIGNRDTKVIAGKLVTMRGYREV